MLLTAPTSDIASGLFQGQRKTQQDTVVSHTDVAAGVSIMALSDGMGGAAHGNIASRIIVQTAFDSVQKHISEISKTPKLTPDFLRTAASAANRKLASYIDKNADMAGMGGTLIVVVVVNARVFWVSIGDSLLFRMTKGNLNRLNADHSLAKGLDNLASLGQIDPRIAKSMASRSTLTSALQGEELKQIDCPDAGLPILKGDLIILASDGIQSISDQSIAVVLNQSDASAAKHVSRTIAAIEEADIPGQDNLGPSGYEPDELPDCSIPQA